MDHERVTLSNGVRVLISEMPEARSVSVAVYVGVGSRSESKLNAGTSHFLEHMVFKGTAKRPTASEISQQIEGVGGSVNASTDKEATVFSAFVPARHYLLALDVVADMVRSPLLRETDVESERNVIVEEIRMYRDQAPDRVHTMIDELLYPAHPLGWEIAGREAVVLGLTAQGLRDFMAAGYAPSRIVVALAGRLDAGEARRAVEAHFGDLTPRAPLPMRPAPRPGRLRTKVLAKRGEQAHICIGWRGVAQDHPEQQQVKLQRQVDVPEVDRPERLNLPGIGRVEVDHRRVEPARPPRRRAARTALISRSTAEAARAGIRGTSSSKARSSWTRSSSPSRPIRSA